MKKNKLGVVSKIYLGLIFLFLYVPIGVLIFMSFNKGNTTVWKGFSLKWYGELFKSTRLMNALGNTLIIAALASVLATILGTAAAIGINNFRGKSRALIQNASNLPIISPDIVMGVSLMLLFSFLGVIFHFEMGFGTVLISHICFCVPFVVLNVMPRLRRMDQSIYDAALDLGCNQWQAFYKVVIHELMPGILSGMLMSFTYSVDDFVITHFTQGAKFNNLSTEIYAMLRRKIPPTINALSTLLFVAIVVIMVLINVFERRAEKKQAKLK
ncbi:MAG: ABC transporter permease [Ruminococcus sp.]|nr:ABC transporter permease [Ruminococcus sp.]